MTWAPVGSNLNLIPEECANASACAAHNDSIYIFGGDGRAKENRSNLLVHLQTHGETIAVRPCSVIPGRFMHTATMFPTKDVGAYLLVLGGVGQEDDILGDCWAISTADFSCSPLDTVRPPHPRAAHSAVFFDDALWVFGGMDELYNWKEYRTLDSFEVLDLQTMPLEWRPVPAAGAPPTPRMDHGCAVHRNVMYVFGGSHNDRTRFLNDLHAFDFHTQTWTAVTVHSPLPAPRVGTGLVVAGEMLYVFGGRLSGLHFTDELLCFDLVHSTWHLVGDSGKRPSIRWSHLAVEVGGFLYIMGGSKRKSGLVQRHTDCRKIRLQGLRLLPITDTHGAVETAASSEVRSPEAAREAVPRDEDPTDVPDAGIRLATLERRAQFIRGTIEDRQKVLERNRRIQQRVEAEVRSSEAELQAVEDQIAALKESGDPGTTQWSEEEAEPDTVHETQDAGGEARPEGEAGDWQSGAQPAEVGGQWNEGGEWATASGGEGWETADGAEQWPDWEGWEGSWDGAAWGPDTSSWQPHATAPAPPLQPAQQRLDDAHWTRQPELPPRQVGGGGWDASASAASTPQASTGSRHTWNDRSSNQTWGAKGDGRAQGWGSGGRLGGGNGNHWRR